MSTLPGRSAVRVMREQVATRPVRPANCIWETCEPRCWPGCSPARPTAGSCCESRTWTRAGCDRDWRSSSGPIWRRSTWFDGEPVVQSRRAAAYAAALEMLADRTYECFCTRREIAEAASAPHELSVAIRAPAGAARRSGPTGGGRVRRRSGCAPTALSRWSTTCTAECAEWSTTSWSGATTGWRPITSPWWSTTPTPAWTKWSAATICCPLPSARPCLAELLGHAPPTYAPYRWP